MGENELKSGRQKGRRPARFLAAGTSGLAATIALLMVLSPWSAGAHPSVVLKAPYTGTVWSPSASSSFSGCAKAKAAAGHWTSTTGVVTGATSGTASPCAKSLAGAGAYSSGYAGTGVTIAVPFKVASNGNHSVGSTWSFTLASTNAFTMSGCPAKNIKYPPALYASEYGYCEAGTSTYFDISASVTDLSNGSWYSHNYSYGFVDNYSYWENYTDCYNYGTPTCVNTTGAHSYAYACNTNAPGFSAFTFSGTTVFTLWTNGTGMVKADKYALTFYRYLSGGAFTYAYNLKTHWAATASDTINMATLGNGATLSSVSIS